MQNKSKFVIALSIISLVVLCACQFIPSFAATATPTEAPTSTPYPTYTPYPTFTEIPTLAATATPRTIATLLPTKRPTQAAPVATKAPVKPTATSGGAASGGGSTPVTWKNETSHYLKIVASGPANYTVNLSGGQELMVYWVAGTYNITYYLDGSDSAGGYDVVNVVEEEHNLYTVNFH